MIKLHNIEVEKEKYFDIIYKYIEVVFEFDSLLAHIKLTDEGLKRYTNTPEGILESILMCNSNNPDFRKYDRFKLECEHWDNVFNDRFMGFDYIDINMAIAAYTIDQVEEILKINPKYSIFELTNKD